MFPKRMKKMGISLVCSSGMYIPTFRKARLEAKIVNLRKEYHDIYARIEKVKMTENQKDEIQKFCGSIRDCVDTAIFEEKLQLLVMFDVHGKLTVENYEKVVYVSCLLKPQPVSLALTSHLPNSHEVNSIILTARLIVKQGLSLADMLLGKVSH